MAERRGALVTCVGGAVVDRKLHLRAQAVPGTSNPARMVRSDGGVARNVAETLARLGVPAALVSRVGADEEGRGIVARLRAAGVDTAGVAAVPGGLTAEYVAMLDGGDLVIGAAAMDVLDEIRTEDVDRQWPPAGSGWVFLDCNCPADVIGHALARARANGVPVAVDAVSVPKARRLPGDLGGITVLFCNRAEAEVLLMRNGAARAEAARADVGPAAAGPGGGTAPGGGGGAGGAAPRGRGDGSSAGGATARGGGGGSGAAGAAEGGDLAEALRAAGARGVVLTEGAQGLVVADSDGVRLVPSLPAVPVDTTGAGDALVGGTLAGLVSGEVLAEAAAFGTVVAALTLSNEHTVRPDLTRALVERAAAERRPPVPTGQPR